MILKNAMEITFARVELTSSELEISFPIHHFMFFPNDKRHINAVYALYMSVFTLFFTLFV